MSERYITNIKMRAFMVYFGLLAIGCASGVTLFGLLLNPTDFDSHVENRGRLVPIASLLFLIGVMCIIIASKSADKPVFGAWALTWCMVWSFFLALIIFEGTVVALLGAAGIISVWQKHRYRLDNEVERAAPQSRI